MANKDCPECGGVGTLEADDLETVCTNCGLVLEDDDELDEDLNEDDDEEPDDDEFDDEEDDFEDDDLKEE